MTKNQIKYLKLKNDLLSRLSKFRSEEYEGLRLDGQSASDTREILRDIQYDVLHEIGEGLDQIYFPDL